VLNEKPTAGGKREKLLAGGEEEVQVLQLYQKWLPRKNWTKSCSMLYTELV